MIEPGEMTTAELGELIEQCERVLAGTSPYAHATVTIDVARLKWLTQQALRWVQKG